MAAMSYVPVKLLLFQQRHHVSNPEGRVSKIEIAGLVALAGKDLIERRFYSL